MLLNVEADGHSMTAVIWRGQSTVIFVHLDYLKEVINKSV